MAAAWCGNPTVVTHFSTYAGLRLTDFSEEEGNKYNCNTRAQLKKAVPRDTTWKFVLPEEVLSDEDCNVHFNLNNVDLVRLVRRAFDDAEERIPRIQKLVDTLSDSSPQVPSS
eukprot:2021744-Rhodomonas_salina.2